MIRLLVTAAVAALLAVPAAGARPSDTPGVTATQILLGATGPLSGSESQYQPVLSGAQAYFSYVNDHGGVLGRKIVYKVEDDQYDPAQTVGLTQKLVEQDKVFADYGSLGTAPVLATRAYLNQRKVPQVLVATGDSYWGSQYKQYPWTIGWQPDYPGEAKIYAQFILAKVPQAKIGILYQNDAYGLNYLNAFKSALGSSGQAKIVSAQSYDVTATTVTQQVVALKSAGANTFMIFATPTPTIQALVVATKIGWHPTEFINSVSAVEVFQALAAKAGASVDGAISVGYGLDPNVPAQTSLPGVALAKQILDTYDRGATVFNILNIYGLSSAWTMVEALKNAGSPPTRAGLLNALTHLNLSNNPWLIRGIKEKTSPTDHYPIDQLFLTRYHSGGPAGIGYWDPFGRTYSNAR